MSGFRLARPKFGAGVGFARLRAVADIARLDLDRWAERSASIAGSNGKGSVALMLDAILRASLARVGRFISPHYFRLNERFAIDGAAVGDEALAPAWARIEAAAARYEAAHPDDRLGAFEFLTLTAWALFEAHDVDFAVMECGIGARYDATRLGRPRWAALVSLDIEHAKLLGASLELIAYDKLDAAASGGAVYIGAQCAGLREEMRAYCALRGVRDELVDTWSLDAGVLAIPLAHGRTARVRLPLAGAHQMANAALAARLADEILCARALGADARQAAIETALATIELPGRLETIAHAPMIVIDVGHTPRAVAAAKTGFFEMAPVGPHILVCAVSADKDGAGMCAALAEGFDLAIATAGAHKPSPPAQVAAWLGAARPGLALREAPDIAAAWRQAASEAAARGASVLVAGSLFAAIEFKAVHLGMDPRALVFL